MSIRKGERMTKGNKKSKKRLLTGLAALAVCIIVLCVPAIRARAVFDESTAVRFRVFKQSNTIENSVLFIGTHLIHMQALTDELYEVAMDTATDADQHNIYYKSELADGEWFDITDAGSIADISTEGVMVDESELDDLWVTSYTGKDGLTKDARSGETVCIFDQPSPYDLLNLPELDAVKQVYTGKYSENSDGLDKYFYEELSRFFNSTVKNEATDACDRQLASLQKCYESYSTAGMDEQAEVLMSLMEAVDAARRTEVFYQISECESNLLETLLGVASGSDYSPTDDYNSETFIPDEMLLEAVGTAIQQCKESYIRYESKQLEEGGTALRHYIYEQSQQLTALCEAADGELSSDSEIDAAITKIRYAMNIENDIVGDADEELKLIEDEFLPEAEKAYGDLLKSGVSDTYQAAKSADKGLAKCESILREDQSALETKREELQYMIAAARMRKSSADALQYMYERMSWAEDSRSGIRNDDFKGYANESVSAHIEWLNDQAQQIINGDASLMSLLEQLKQKLQDYLDKQREALDNNNLELAAQYGALADDMSAQIAKEQERLQAVLNSDSATAQEKAQAQVALGNSSLLDSIDGMKKDAMTAINTGDTEGLEQTLDALAVLGAEDALGELQDALKASNLSDKEKESLGKSISSAKEKSKESTLHGKANAAGSDGAGTGSGASQAASYSADELIAMISQVFGGTFDSLSAENQIAAVAALEWLYEEYGNANAASLAQQYAGLSSRNGNPYVYTQLADHKEIRYLPLNVTARASGFRYVYSDSRQEATLTSARQTLRFRVGSSQVTKTDNTVEEIKNYKVEYQINTPYVDQNTAQKYFDCEAAYISNTDYGVCLNAKIRALADTLYQAFTGEA